MARVQIEERDLRIHWELAWGAYQGVIMRPWPKGTRVKRFDKYDPYAKARPKTHIKAVIDHMVAAGKGKLTVKPA